jgi:hypothetical protein
MKTTIKILGKRLFLRGIASFIGGFILVSLIISCTKETIDDRDKFIGTWTGTVNSIIPALSSNTNNATSMVIAKGTGNAKQITLSNAGTNTTAFTANVNGNKYTYDEYTASATDQGITVTAKFNGTGTLIGNTLTESGTIIYTISGQTISGTWSSTLTKQ